MVWRIRCPHWRFPGFEDALWRCLLKILRPRKQASFSKIPHYTLPQPAALRPPSHRHGSGTSVKPTSWRHSAQALLRSHTCFRTMRRMAIQLPRPWITPANQALNPQRITRSLIRQAGFLHLEDFQRLEDEMNAQQREDLLLQGLQGLKCLTVSLANYDGSTKTIVDWLDDFDRYCTDTKRESNADKLSTLISHLVGDAKQWFVLQAEETCTDYTKLRPALLTKFSPTSQEKFSLKSKIYATKQQVNQSFNDYVRQQQLAARTAGLPQEELTSICISGALPTLRAHLAMAQPQTIDDLLKLPLVLNEVNDEPLYAMMQTLSTRVDNIEANAKNISSPAARSRTPSPEETQRRTPGVLPSASRTPPWFGRDTDGTFHKTGPRRDTNGTDTRQWSDRSRQWTSPSRYARNKTWTDSARQWPGPTTNSHGNANRPWMRAGPRLNPTHRMIPTTSSCSKCGLLHSFNEFCPAYQQTCFRCGGLNHFKRMCISRTFTKHFQGQ